MDKLKPILDNKFWVFLFLALLLPTIGWFIASGTFAKEIEERQTALDQAFNSVKITSDVPNPDWTSSAAVLVEDEQNRLDRTSVKLWESQKRTMDWPPGVQELVLDVPYEGAIPARARENYRRLGQGYERQLSEIEAILNPYDPDTRTGLILVNRASYPHVPSGTWTSRPPTHKEMWNAQIDAWLVRSIFKAIAAMNRGSDKLSSSTIVQLVELKLRGGIRDYASSQGTSTAAGGMPTGSGGEEYNMETYAGAPGGGEGYGSTGGAGKLNVKVQFDLSDELGPDAGARGGAAQGGYGSMTMNADAATPSGPSAAGAPQGPRRYVDDDENLPFRTRGFVLGVVMHHGYLNDFLAELSGSEWPVQVLRVHQQMNNPDNLAMTSGRPGTRTRGSATRSSRPRGGFGGGFGGGAGYGGSAEGGGYSDGEYGLPGGAGGGGAMGRPGGSTMGAASGLRGNNDIMIQQALSDPHLATVWIGGLITLFKPVEDPATEQAATATDELMEEPSAEATDPLDSTPGETDPENLNSPAPASEQPAEPTDEPAEIPAEADGEKTDPQPLSDETQPAPENPEP